MADISKCTGKKCPKKDSCYRFKAVSNPHWQSYLMVPPIDDKGNCNMYWKMDTPKDVK